ncbi:MAG: hypothetical protein EZS28_000493 [Streblomastix strix]|uniref:Uncharacterized protein n=1 Tax=Streblomastix strix TaxID=222440 RepID=A0A5J4XA32_9EUKA|nr:MAG: hypothetical protein EZS28_000493 [Streblomastix strix]
MIKNITAISEVIWLRTKFRANIPAQLVQIPPQMTMTTTTDAAPNGSAYEVPPKLQKICEFNLLRSEAITDQQFSISGNGEHPHHQQRKSNKFPKQQKNQEYRSRLITSQQLERDRKYTKWTIKDRKQQTKEVEISTHMSSDELEHNNRIIFSTLQQSTAKIHVNKKETRRNNNRCSQSNMEEGTTMDSTSYPSPSSSSEEDQRRADRSNDNSSTMARPDMVHRTGKRECSVPYAQLEQRNSGTKNIVNQKEFETFIRKDMLFSDGPKARKGRRFARKIFRIKNFLKGAKI